MPINAKAPTIYDVADQAGVSISTISRMLNDPEKVNPATREKIMEVIDRLGFVPKAEARARALKINRRIGVITPFFTAPSFVQRLRGITGALASEKYELVVYSVESTEQFANYINNISLARNLDGLIVMSLPISDEQLARLQGLPVVLVEYRNNNVSCIEIDDVAGGKMAANYLIGKGHRRIAFIGDSDLPEFSIQPVSKRLKGFKSAMAAAGLEVPEELVALVPYTQEATRAAANEWLQMANPPSAIFAATDFQALSLLKTMHRAGVQVPQQLAIVGFDNLDLAEYADLTTISQHLDESGTVAVEVLLNRINDPGRPVQHINLPLSIIERETA